MSYQPKTGANEPTSITEATPKPEFWRDIQLSPAHFFRMELAGNYQTRNFRQQTITAMHKALLVGLPIVIHFAECGDQWALPQALERGPHGFLLDITRLKLNRAQAQYYFKANQ